MKTLIVTPSIWMKLSACIVRFNVILVFHIPFTFIAVTIMLSFGRSMCSLPGSGTTCHLLLASLTATRVIRSGPFAGLWLIRTGGSPISWARSSPFMSVSWRRSSRFISAQFGLWVLKFCVSPWWAFTLWSPSWYWTTAPWTWWWHHTPRVGWRLESVKCCNKKASGRWIKYSRMLTEETSSPWTREYSLQLHIICLFNRRHTILTKYYNIANFNVKLSDISI